MFFLEDLRPEILLAMTAFSFAGGQWETAREIFQGMMPSGCKPDAITYGTLISVLDRGNQWGHALQVMSVLYHISESAFDEKSHSHLQDRSSLQQEGGLLDWEAKMQRCCAGL